MVETEKLMIFGSVRFALFVKNLKTLRFLERDGSRYIILTKNGNELCTVRFALFNEKTVGYLARYGRGFLSPNRGNGRSRNGTSG